MRGVCGEGVKGIRPPAVRVEKSDERLLTGVRIAGVAIVWLSAPPTGNV